MIDAGYPKELNMFRVFELCELDWMYRGGYHLLSRSAHAGFHSGFTDVEPDGYIHFLIHMTPVEISNYLHWSITGESAEGHAAFRKDISAASFKD